MTDDLTPDAPSKVPKFLRRLSLASVCFTTLAFWSVIGAAVALFFGDWFALGWATVAFVLAVVLVRDYLYPEGS